MDTNNKTDLEIISSANKEMLDYFNSLFLENLEEIQNIKTQSFEIDIKIDELENLLEEKRSLRFEPEYYQDQTKMRELDEEIDDIHNRIHAATETWELAMEEMENR